jgi:hypothetical protein
MPNLYQFFLVQAEFKLNLYFSILLFDLVFLYNRYISFELAFRDQDRIKRP